MLTCCPPGRRRRRKDRPRNSWMQEVTTGMREKGINNVEWIDREEWKRKIKLQTQNDVKILSIHKEIKLLYLGQGITGS